MAVPRRHGSSRSATPVVVGRDFAIDLLALAATCDRFATVRTPYGVKYVVKGQIGRKPHRTAGVLAVWIVEAARPPRLVTAYPDEESCLPNILSSYSIVNRPTKGLIVVISEQSCISTKAGEPSKSSLLMAAGTLWP